MPSYIRPLIAGAIIGLCTINVNAGEWASLKAFENSYIYEKNGDWAKAIETMKWLNTSTSYEANLRLGWLHYCAKLYTVSVSYYKKALSINRASEEARLGIILPLSALGYWDEVIAAYNEILSNCPGNSAINYKLGMIYYNRGDYSKAYPLFAKVVELYPFDYSGLLMYAWSAFKTGKPREAESSFNKVLLCSPRDKSALEGLQMIKAKK